MSVAFPGTSREQTSMTNETRRYNCGNRKNAELMFLQFPEASWSRYIDIITCRFGAVWMASLSHVFLCVCF